MAAPKASNCSAIWNASSRVGVKTSANSLWGVFNNACNTGRANAAVLPEPVSANPIMSRPKIFIIQTIPIIMLNKRYFYF